MPIHCHLASSETVALLRGKIRWYFYDDNGKVDEKVVLDANGDVRCINMEWAAACKTNALVFAWFEDADV